MKSRQTQVLNKVLDGMEGKLPNAKITNAGWATIGNCTALRDINDLPARAVLGMLDGGAAYRVFVGQIGL